MYTKLIAKNGKEMFYKNGRLVKREEYEANTQTVDEKASEPSQLTRTKTCLFCALPGEYIRFVNGSTIDLCHEHYARCTVGELAERLNHNEG